MKTLCFAALLAVPPFAYCDSGFLESIALISEKAAGAQDIKTSRELA